MRLPAAVGHLCRVVSRQGESCLAEVIGFQGKQVQIMPFAPQFQFQQGDQVVALERRMRVPAGWGLLGRVINCQGQPIDDRGPLHGYQMIDLRVDPPSPLARQDIREVFQTGQKAIDGVLTMGLGQRVGLFAGSGVGKSTLLGDIAKFASADLNVVALIGERGREVKPFIEEALGAAGRERSIVVVSLADETPLARVRAGETAIAIAHHFRQQGQKVLLMFDSLTRWAMAQRELGLLLNEPPTARGYTPSVFQKLAVLLEQLGNSDQGSITALLTVLVEGDDVNDPVADSVRSIVDGHIVLSRDLANSGHFPAIDILQSASRLFLEITSPEQRKAAQAIRQILSLHRDVADLIQVGAYQKGAAPRTDLAIQMLPQIHKYLQQAIGHPCSWSDNQQLLKKINDLWKNSEK